MVIVPVKPLALAKSRLAGVMGQTERIALARQLVERTLLKLSRARGISRVVVVSRDETVLKIARKYGAWSVMESPGNDPASSLNAALEQARRVCVANGARAVLIVPADLPKLRVRDIEQIIGLGEPAPRLVITPAVSDGGTNALLLNPANAIPFQFGENSFGKHSASANAQAIPIVEYTSDTVTLDLDTPQDLDQSRLDNS